MNPYDKYLHSFSYKHMWAANCDIQSDPWYNDVATSIDIWVVMKHYLIATVGKQIVIWIVQRFSGTVFLKS